MGRSGGGGGGGHELSLECRQTQIRSSLRGCQQIPACMEGARAAAPDAYLPGLNLSARLPQQKAYEPCMQQILAELIHAAN